MKMHIVMIDFWRKMGCGTIVNYPISSHESHADAAAAAACRSWAAKDARLNPNAVSRTRVVSYQEED